MNVLIVVESCFGNTAAIADAAAAGLRAAGARVEVVTAADAPADAGGADLVLVGAPTHNRGLPTPRSRARAVARGATPPASGVAEWLAARPALGGVRAVAFDTAVRGRFAGSAATRIDRSLRRLGARTGPRQSFHVAEARLLDGELDRARAWAAGLTG